MTCARIRAWCGLVSPAGNFNPRKTWRPKRQRTHFAPVRSLRTDCNNRHRTLHSPFGSTPIASRNTASCKPPRMRQVSPSADDRCLKGCQYPALPMAVVQQDNSQGGCEPEIHRLRSATSFQTLAMLRVRASTSVRATLLSGLRHSRLSQLFLCEPASHPWTEDHTAWRKVPKKLRDETG